MKEKIDKKAFKYEGKKVHIEQEGDKIYLKPTIESELKKNSCKKENNGKI